MSQSATLTRKSAARRRAYKLFGLALILLAFALALPAGASASLSGDRDGATLPGFAPPLLEASGVLSGHVYDFDGSPLSGAGVWGSAVAADEYVWSINTNTDAQGSFSFSDAPATTQGRLLVSPNTTDSWYTKNLTFADPGPTVYDVQPGRLDWTATRGGPWAAEWSNPRIDVVGTTAGPVVISASTLKTGVSASSAVQGWASALPGNVTYVVFSFSASEAAIWDARDPGNAPFAVTAGAVATTQLSFDEATSRRLSYEVGPYWASGAPGTTVTLGFENYPQGEQAAMQGYSENWAEASLTTWNDRTFTSTGASKQTIELAIPAGAVPGLNYVLSANSTEVISNVWVFSLTQSFQVCTLKSVPAAVKKGAAVKLSGVVPVKGNLEGPGVATGRRRTGGHGDVVDGADRGLS